MKWEMELKFDEWDDKKRVQDRNARLDGTGVWEEERGGNEERREKGKNELWIVRKRLNGSRSVHLVYRTNERKDWIADTVDTEQLKHQKKKKTRTVFLHSLTISIFALPSKDRKDQTRFFIFPMRD